MAARKYAASSRDRVLMQDKSTRPEQQSPTDIAREAFRRLAMRRIAPTPDAYREIYDEVAGIREPLPAEKLLADLASSLTKGSSEVAAYSRRLAESLKTRDWESYGKQLNQLVEKHLVQPSVTPTTATLTATEKAGAETAPPNSPAKTTSLPLVDEAPPRRASVPLVDDIPVSPRKASIPLVDDIPPPPKKASIPLVDDIPPPRAKTSIPLVDHIGPPPDKDTIASVDVVDQPEHSTAEALPGTPAPQFNDTQLTRMLREMLVRAMTLAIPSLLEEGTELVQESESLAEAINRARSRQVLAEVEPRFKQFCFRVEMKGGDMAEERELLLRLFQLLIENIGELVDDDSWLSGQIANVQEILSGRINYATLLDATRSLKEVIYKQGLLKHSLTEAKASVKTLMLTVIDRLGTVATSTGDYHKKIENYSLKITHAKGVGDLNQVLDDILRDTRFAQEDALRSQHDMLLAQKEVQSAEARIHELENQLAEMSELAHEDQLTGSLNRRGLDEVLAREMARAERTKSPLCVAMLDLDDFKKLNDTHGHHAGDNALIHVVKVVKDTLRTMDIIARFGGEEFMIVLPNTPIEDAMQTVTRVQRELTKQIFMHDNQRLLITFSGGVALYKPGEDQATLIQRADEAAYKAKKAGKNRVVRAE